jgi:hypothetical protein
MTKSEGCSWRDADVQGVVLRHLRHLFAKNVIGAHEVFHDIQCEVLKPAGKCVSKLFWAFLCHGHDVCAQFLGFDNDQQVAFFFVLSIIEI